MAELKINLGDKSYPVYINSGFENIGACMEKAGIKGRTVLITDPNVDRHHGEDCIKMLEAAGINVIRYIIKAGEESKNLDTVRDIYSALNRAKLDRDSALIALGGGVVGDITGFAAATYLRGIAYIQIPTTLLAQADSSVGGKTGVDFEGCKNIIGSFYQPRFVFINTDTLRTLHLRDIRSGLAETIKHGIILDRDFFEYIERSITNILRLDRSVLEHLTEKNCLIKGRIVEMDEKEEGIRAILNFGHTIGHAIESAMGFSLLHGECVSVGIMGAFKLAQYIGLADEKTQARVARLLQKTGLPISTTGPDAETVYEYMYYDKKTKGGKLNFILPQSIGNVIRVTLDDKRLIMKVLDELLGT